MIWDMWEIWVELICVVAFIGVLVYLDNKYKG